MKKFFTNLKDYYFFYFHFKSEIKKYKKKNKKLKNRNLNIVVPIFYWGGTNVTYLQLQFALNFIKNGANVYFIYDNQIEFKLSYFVHSLIIRKIIRQFKKNLNAELINFNTAKSANLEKKYEQIAKNKEYFNLQWIEKRSIKYSEFLISPKKISRNIQICENMENLMHRNNIDLCFCPGGIHGNSFLWRKVCDVNNIRFSSFDGNKTKTIVTLSGMAAHRDDVLSRLSDLKNDNENLNNSITDAVYLEIYKRSKLSYDNIDDLYLRTTKNKADPKLIAKFVEDYASTKSKYENYLEQVAIFLNTSWDAASADLEPWEETQIDWLDKLILDLSKGHTKKIIIRQHPDEKFFPSNDNYEKIISNYQNRYQHLTFDFFKSENSISSYAIIKESTSVFTFSSTIGLEACILNRASFIYKKNYQLETKSLIRYVPNCLDLCAREYFQNENILKNNAINAYFYGQHEGWEDISIPYFLNDLKNNVIKKRISEISKNIVNNSYN